MVPVVLFHAGFKGFSGGFVGVDIFFVISGYLITNIIAAEMRAGTFSIAQFYERRARRILPALFVVMLACLPLAWLWMLPAQLEAFGKSLIAVSFFVSNVLFYRTSGYFGAGVEESTLLHTWSLGVEEQFYVVFPLLVLVLWRVGVTRLTWIIATIAVCSFGVAEWGSRTHPNGAFYLAPTRAWELLIGSLLALATLRGPLSERVGPRRSNALAALGLLMVIGAIVLYSKATPFPGVYALLPTVGTALILGFATTETAVARLLALRWIAGVGLISYSAYLWHQPLFAFVRILTLGHVTTALALGLTALTFALAYLTWRFVENPFRGRGLLTRRAVFAVGIAGSLFFAGVGGAKYAIGGDHQSSYATRVNYGLGRQCDFSSDFNPIPGCATSDTPKMLVWGDSFAMHLIAGIIASDETVALVQATKSICGPALGVAPRSRTDLTTTTLQGAAQCIAFNNSVLDYLARQSSVDVVVLSSPFHQYVTASAFTLHTERGSVPASVPTAAHHLNDTVRALRAIGKRVVVVAPPPSSDFNIGKCTERLLLGMALYGRARGCDIERSSYVQATASTLALLNTIQAEAGVPVVSFDEALCDATSCTTIVNGMSIYRDGGHLSYGGSAFLGRRMALAKQIQFLAR